MWQSIKKLFKSNYLFTFGVIICLFWILMAILAPVLAPYDPVAQDLTIRLQPPSAEHWFGTDNFGQDIFSRVLYGGRYSLLAGCLTVVIAGIIGTFYGAIAGYAGGVVDNVMMRFSEMILSFPSLILAMIINAVMGSNLFNTMFALIIVAWPTYARLMRSVVLSVKENEYVTASRALGLKTQNLIEGDHSRQRQLCSYHGDDRSGKSDTDVFNAQLSGAGFRTAYTGVGHDGIGRCELLQQILDCRFSRGWPSLLWQ